MKSTAIISLYLLILASYPSCASEYPDDPHYMQHPHTNRRIVECNLLYSKVMKDYCPFECDYDYHQFEKELGKCMQYKEKALASDEAKYIVDSAQNYNEAMAHMKLKCDDPTAFILRMSTSE